jgi:hypothetical protein
MLNQKRLIRLPHRYRTMTPADRVTARNSAASP